MPFRLGVTPGLNGLVNRRVIAGVVDRPSTTVTPLAGALPRRSAGRSRAAGSGSSAHEGNNGPETAGLPISRVRRTTYHPLPDARCSTGGRGSDACGGGDTHFEQGESVEPLEHAVFARGGTAAIEGAVMRTRCRGSR